MRDPARIRPLLDELAAAWEKSPDLRLGQLILALIDKEPTEVATSLYYIEDEPMREAIKKLVAS